MSDLRAMLARLGVVDAQILGQTGSLVFRANPPRGRDFEATLEKAAAKDLNVCADVLVRTAGEWARIIASNPFADEATRDPSHLVVMVLKDAPSPRAVHGLRSAMRGPERIHVAGTHAYISYPAGIGRSQLTGALIERRLGTRGTGRNWNTVVKLAALAQPRMRRTNA